MSSEYEEIGGIDKMGSYLMVVDEVTGEGYVTNSPANAAFAATGEVVKTAVPISVLADQFREYYADEPDQTFIVYRVQLNSQEDLVEAQPLLGRGRIRSTLLNYGFTLDSKKGEEDFPDYMYTAIEKILRLARLEKAKPTRTPDAGTQMFEAYIEACRPGKVPSKKAIQTASMFLATLQEVSQLRVSPTLSEEGVLGLYWRKGQDYLSIEMAESYDDSVHVWAAHVEGEFFSGTWKTENAHPFLWKAIWQKMREGEVKGYAKAKSRATRRRSQGRTLKPSKIDLE